MNDDIENDLRDYLAAEKRDRQRKEIAGDPIVRLANEVELLNTKFDGFVVRVDERFKGQEARLTKLEDAAEHTGNYNVEQLREKVKDERDSKTRILGYVIAAMGAIGLLGLGGAGTIVWFLITKGHN